MREFMAITKALSDPNRVRILLALRRGELCVCQITELFGFAPSTVSKHLSILHHAAPDSFAQVGALGLLPAAGQVRARRRARGAGLGSQVARQNGRSRADAKKLKKILKTDLAVICRRQKCC